MITVVGSLNLDFFIDSPRLPTPGETILGHRFRRACGGKGANQACAVARLGTATELIGCVGADPFGQEMIDNLTRFGVGSRGIIRRTGVDSGLAFIVVDDSGGNQIVVASGANATLAPSDLDAHRDLITQSRALIAQLEVPLPAVERALRLARAAGVMTLLNPAPAVALSEELLALCDWIIPNEREAEFLAGQPLRSPTEADGVAAALRRRAPESGVLITLGAAGAWLDHRGTRTAIPALPVKAVDTVGAGDAFVGAFAVRLTEGAPPVEAAGFAAAAAALAVTNAGAQAGLPTRHEVEILLTGK